MNKINPDEMGDMVASATPPDVWWQVLAYWKSDNTGRLYTYLVPPGVGIVEGDWFLVEDPKGGTKTLRAFELRETFPVNFLCKPIGNVLSPDEKATIPAQFPDGMATQDDLDAMLRGALDANGLDDHYEEWKIEAHKMHVEGR